MQPITADSIPGVDSRRGANGKELRQTVVDWWYAPTDSRENLLLQHAARRAKGGFVGEADRHERCVIPEVLHGRLHRFGLCFSRLRETHRGIRGDSASSRRQSLRE